MCASSTRPITPNTIVITKRISNSTPTGKIPVAASCGTATWRSASIAGASGKIPSATTPLHRWLFLNAPIRLHAHDLNAAWTAVDELSRQFATVVLAAAERRPPH